jgi:KaiC/GvpD/RAD55 family RecA-like ATPase
MSTVESSRLIPTMLDGGASNEPAAGLAAAPARPMMADGSDATAISRRKYDINTPAELRRRHQCLRQEGEFLIEGLIPRRTVGIVVGDSGIGKSPLLYQAAVCVAAGVPFLGRPTTKGPVIYLDFENGVGQVDDMLDRLAKCLELSVLPDTLWCWNANDARMQLGVLGLSDLLNELKPALLIIDSLSAFRPNAEDKPKNATGLMQEMRRYVREHGMTVLVVHHLKKSSTKREEARPELEDAQLPRWFLEARGAGALINSSDVRIGIDRVSENLRFHTEREIVLVMRGFGRVRGELPTIYLERLNDTDGEPIGYAQVAGPSLLFHSGWERAYGVLPDKFRFKDAQPALGKGASSTTAFLRKCVDLGIARKVAGGGYEKTADGGVSGARS